MKYNLIRNAYFDSLTVSGTGNVDLSWAQLESLMDGNLTSSGVILTAPNVLYLEVDLSQRIKVDGIKLYASDLTKSANIKFYYKNSESDSYSGLATQVGTYYYTTIAAPSAPRYIRATISGVALDLYEFQIFNDDYIVAFGEDGSQYSEYLDNTPVGEEGTPEAIALFNNDTSAMPADAYACIDYTGNAGDLYVKISSAENGTYYGITDGAVITDNNSTGYIWNMGTFDGTTTDNNSIILSAAARKLGHLPNGSADEAFRTGANTWDWDTVNKKMYVMGLEGTTLSLWDYDYTLDAWNYLTNLAPAVAANDRFPVMSYCDGAIYVISKFDGTFGKYTISGAVDNWTDLPNPTFSGVVIDKYDRVSMCSDGVRYIYALTSDYGQDTLNRNFRRFDTVSDTWSSMDSSYRQYDYSGSSSAFTNTSCLTYDYDKDRVYLINASEEQADGGHYIQLYNVSANSWGTNWFNVTTVYNTLSVVESIWYHNKWLYVSCNPYFDTGYFFRYNLDTTAIEKLNLGYVHYNPAQADVVGVYMIAIDNDNSFGSSVYFAQINDDRKYLYNYNTFPSTDGTYITPVIELADKYKSSYFTNEQTTTSGLSNISYDTGSYNGTFRIRSSNTSPIDIDEIYWLVGNYISRLIIYDSSETPEWVYVDSLTYPRGTAVDRRTGNVAVIRKYSGVLNGYVYTYDRDGNLLQSTGSSAWYGFLVNMEFEKSGGLWFALYTNALSLVHVDSELNQLYILSPGYDFVYDLATDQGGEGVWYTDKVDDLVRHLDSDGVAITSIALSEPRAVCSTSDNGCWVFDSNTQYMYRYTSAGILSKSVSIDLPITRMTTDWQDGAWLVHGNYVSHMTSAGNIDISNVVIGAPADRIRGGYNGCIVWSETNGWVKYVNKNSGAVTRTFNASSTAFPGLFSYRHADHLSFQTDFIPTSCDPVWGTNGSLQWREVRKDGYFLPRDKYHQAEYTLRTDSSQNPRLDSVILAPAIKVQDILPQSSKNMYVRTDIPSSVDPSDHETRLKVWWGVEA